MPTYCIDGCRSSVKICPFSCLHRICEVLLPFGFVLAVTCLLSNVWIRAFLWYIRTHYFLGDKEHAELYWRTRTVLNLIVYTQYIVSKLFYTRREKTYHKLRYIWEAESIIPKLCALPDLFLPLGWGLLPPCPRSLLAACPLFGGFHCPLWGGLTLPLMGGIPLLVILVLN